MADDADLNLRTFSLTRSEALKDLCDGTWRSLADARRSATATAVLDVAAAIKALKRYPDSKPAREEVVRKAFALWGVWPLKASEESKELSSARDEMEELAVALAKEDWVGFVSAAASSNVLGAMILCRDPSRSCALDAKVRSSLTLAVEIADAKTSDDVKTALDKFSEPVGSWRRKFDYSTLTVNGYVGAKWALESVEDARLGQAVAPVLGLGLDLSTSIRGAARIGLFLQAIDIGNVANVRVAEEDDPDLAKVDVAPDVDWSNLVAPGAYLLLAPKAPFVVGLGGGWVPALRTTAAGPKATWYAGAMLSVDVPIVELSNW
jgi:hypothetical protein